MVYFAYYEHCNQRGNATYNAAFPLLSFMEWRDIPGFEGLYQVSSTGLIRSLGGYRRPIGVQKIKVANGRKRTCLRRDGKNTYMSVSRLVATAFIPNPKYKPFVDHINGNPLDDRVENLRWVTRTENRWNSSGRRRKRLPLGVFHSRGKRRPYIAKINMAGCPAFLGSFHSVEEAAAAYRDAAKALHGQYAKLV